MTSSIVARMRDRARGSFLDESDFGTRRVRRQSATFSSELRGSRPTMEQGYWDLSSILADSVRLPCHFAIDVPGLSHVIGINQGKADDGASSSTIQKKARVDLPYWMAELLALHNVVDLSFPRQYSSRVRNALDAQAKNVRLRDLNAWWYAVGIRLSSLIEAKELVDVLAKTYQARITPIYSSLQNLAASSRGLNTDDANNNQAMFMVNDDVDSFGADLSISMSSEMQDFLHGLDESEGVCESQP
jgi:GINS complex subunit 3